MPTRTPPRRPVPKTEQREIHLIEGQAALFMDLTSPVLAALAGTGGGKTWLMYLMLQNRMELYPGFTWLLAEPTHNLLNRVIINSSDPDRPSLEEWFRLVGHEPDFHREERIIKTRCGQIFLASADNPESLQGAAVRGAFLDEAGLMLLYAYHTARQRTGMMQGQTVLTTTPYNMGWLKTEIADKAGTNGIHVERWRSIDRPGFPRQTYEAMKKVLPPWRFAMWYDAQFEKPEGLIYASFNEPLCVHERFEIPKTWLIYVGHDFGPNNPAAMFYAVDPVKGDVWAYHEYMPGPGKAAPEHVAAWKEITEGYTVVSAVGGQHGEEENRQLYAAHGWPIAEPKIHGPGSVENQILRVIGMHRLNKIHVFRDLLNYLDEKRTFSRRLGDDSKPTEAIDNEAKYHLMAAERYILSDFTPETVEKDEKEAFTPFPSSRRDETGFQDWRERRSGVLVPFGA